MSLPQGKMQIIDDDETFGLILARAMRKRGHEVVVSQTADEALSTAETFQPDYITLDLKMEGPSGLVLLPDLLDCAPDARIIILTGYSSIATAVEAIKLGAVNYICKPADADEILAAFSKSEGDPDVEISDNPISVNRLTWEHIQKVLQEHEGNISATARALGMHRRTLQRKLQKRPVKH